MKKALIVVDYQNDFVSSNGKVAQALDKDSLESSQALLPTIKGLIDTFHEKEDQVFFLISDYNTEYYSGSFKEKREVNPYGNCAIEGTEGHKLFGLSSTSADTVVLKRFLDGFYDTNLDEVLKEKGIEKVYFCGINTDVCVFHTAIGASQRGYHVHVITDATDTTTGNKELFLNYLDQFVGVQLLTTKELG